jgi:hypothetical protein
VENDPADPPQGATPQENAPRLGVSEDSIPKGCDALIEAFQIFKKYIPDEGNPTSCDHDTLYVLVDPAIVTAEDRERLELLGFIAKERDENFYSFRFGSA